MKSIKYIAAIMILLIAVFFIKNELLKKIEVSNLNSHFIIPPKHIERFSFGFNEIMANSIWIRWIQNIDECGKDLTARYKIIENKVDAAEVAKVLNNLDVTQRKEICNQGWAYHMLDAVSNLSPKFRAPYAVGASTLSVISEDHIGAKKIYEKGIKNYPNDWSILYRAAYHYIYELNDYAKGSELLERAAENGAPDWLYSLSARISTLAGKVEFGVRVLEKYLELATTDEARQEIIKRIEAIKSKLSSK